MALRKGLGLALGRRSGTRERLKAAPRRLRRAAR